jgi:hypothetical protein
MTVLRLDDNNAIKVIYFKVKPFIPSDQNCFILTVHKIQDLTLLRICLVLDENIFSNQTYVPFSRCIIDVLLGT